MDPQFLASAIILIVYDSEIRPIGGTVVYFVMNFWKADTGLKPTRQPCLNSRCGLRKFRILPQLPQLDILSLSQLSRFYPCIKILHHYLLFLYLCLLTSLYRLPQRCWPQLWLPLPEEMGRIPMDIMA